MSEAIRDLCSWGDWTLTIWSWGSRRCWTYRRCWGWIPSCKRYWSGKLLYYSFGPFTLMHDKRGGPLGVLADLANMSKEEMAAKLEEARPDE